MRSLFRPQAGLRALMERLIEFVTHHPLMAGAVVLALVAVVTFESRVHSSGVGAISTQDLIRLMNQGALVLDIRKPEEFAAGHVNGAKHFDSDKILNAGETHKRFKDKPVVVICESGSLAAAAVRQLTRQGFTKAFT